MVHLQFPLRTGRLTATVIVAAAVLLVAACAGSGPLAAPPTSPAPTATPTPTPSETPTADPTPTPTSDPAFITILRPEDSATVRIPIAFDGTSNTFEAALTVDAVNEAGDQLCVRHLTATSGSGTPGTWQTLLAFAPESESARPIILRAYELSPKDGSRINLVERPVTLSPTRPAITLTSPACGDTVAAGGVLSVSGVATVFEAQLTVELRDARGTVVFTRYLMTEEGGVESLFGEFVTLPSGLTAGFYDLVAFNTSMKDGSVQNEFAVQITVQS
ncbi:hypothetical protein E3T55_02680 [Cryobacterium frigoriphilum]|uniref:Bacterial spore germination immunoglobulin-like domain-containing protein n=1 Tax=Cryobacterium frigoriphilum TaxID=1259150 RepID=A0A4R9AAB8_9MICO|nr:Gmad2 immunoglobulin-like domain-containing protein [Cryobacterium frigoriphilum]TFD54717.1 hypothetical protein E3T55_02680 [Cryobacterium frigoriphilum]